jgi:hypothetical protein
METNQSLQYFRLTQKMSSFQKGLCPVCRVCFQVKNFKRHWNTQHQRREKKRTSDEVFNTLKANISD